jgi:hypothetical protein
MGAKIGRPETYFQILFQDIHLEPGLGRAGWRLAADDRDGMFKSSCHNKGKSGEVITPSPLEDGKPRRRASTL